VVISKQQSKQQSIASVWIRWSSFIMMLFRYVCFSHVNYKGYEQKCIHLSVYSFFLNKEISPQFLLQANCSSRFMKMDTCW